ncbi:MAG: hypothetical protein ABW252_04700 [Polyangiales bacterium]
MHKLLGVFLFVHALGHAAGFAELTGFRHEGVFVTATLLAGTVPVGAAVAKTLGAAWLALGLGFGAASVAAAVRAPWMPGYAALLAVISLALAVLCWPLSLVGVPMNGALLAMLVAAKHHGALRDVG